MHSKITTQESGRKEERFPPVSCLYYMFLLYFKKTIE